ncbi:hypothetical protein [Effusibacillus lacus]|uniref:Uracil-DNA glycosylase-like domain-containing protein n=1 Tax=Effusibacillus lacus TaxID=1348429 RepID=A0A292YMM6_9BACL|nr:hypothetical protein [Effusibacillus lacus]TCS66740.1 hypothetical protein EDD64_1584 [Effusibacillus lacus]GAX90161.1 hypothetical protein EFBL_1787 [Effusibacillus lacus]
MVDSLAALHAKANIYPESLLGPNVNRSLIDKINTFQELTYLSDFYRKYLDRYDTLLAADTARGSNHMSGSIARSVDLPFIGDQVLNNQRAKFMVDAFRVSNGHQSINRYNRQMNQDLLVEEVRILKPELVVLVGGVSVNIAGDHIQREGVEVQFVNFPSPANRYRIPDYQGDYQKMRERCDQLLMRKGT